MDWMDAWHVCGKNEIEQAVTDQKPPKLIGEAISAFKLESSSGIIIGTEKNTNGTNKEIEYAATPLILFHHQQEVVSFNLFIALFVTKFINRSFFGCIG